MSEAAVIPQHNLNDSSASAVGSVLIIDDEVAIRESLQTLLEMEGYSVECAGTGDEGLTRIGERSFDLVLLDLALPDRNGLDLLGDLQRQDSQLAVIMITAYGTVENAVKAMQAGAVNFIQKPWDNEKLLADVRASVTNLRDALAKSTALLDKLNQGLDQNAENIGELLENIRISTENLKGLTDELRSSPSSLIRGVHVEDRKPGGVHK